MKIMDYYRNELIQIPKELYCVSSSMSFSRSFFYIEGGCGQKIKPGSNFHTPRTFSIVGNIEAKSIDDVEKTRSALISKLKDRLLKLYLEDNHHIYYNCILDGAVNVSYYAGWQVSRVFSISFNLLCYEGVGWGFKKTEYLRFMINNVVSEETRFFYEGNYEVIPSVSIGVKTQNNEEIMVNLDKDFTIDFKVGCIRFKEWVAIRNNEERKILNPFDFDLIGYNDLRIADCVDIESILKPPFLIAEKTNRLEVDTKHSHYVFSTSNNLTKDFYCYVKIEWRDCFL